MVAWVARATTERGAYELDEEADDPEDPPRPNTFLARAVEAAQEEGGGDGDVGGGRQPHSCQFRGDPEEEVDLLGDLSISAGGGAIVDDDAEFERLMNLGPSAHSQFMREARVIASAQPRRKGSHTQAAAPSLPTKGKGVATSQPTKGKGKDIGQAGGPAKGIVIREPTAPAQKKKSYSSGYSGYATTGYPAPYFDPPPFIHVHVHVPVPVQQIDASVEDVQMASLRIVRPRCEVWDHFVREFRRRYNTMMTWDEFRSFVSRIKSYHLIGELPSESDESVQPQWGTYDPYQ
ncbi:hypothetical protein Taro_044530 [Colocasia esculenta]|uniref:Uncharacterized protein n=1 Tax=Colocasia esculenta TaxID=4460 RepID=A0A843X104_COLES|nr:hypothetical protein [Colocasia esculenta]